MAISSDPEGGESTQELRRLFARNYRDFVEQELRRMWEGKWDFADAKSFVYQIGGDIDSDNARIAFLAVLNEIEANPMLEVGRKGGVERKRDILNPKSRAGRYFMEELECDSITAANNTLARAGYGDLLSGLAFKIGSHLHGTRVKLKRTRIAEAFD